MARRRWCRLDCGWRAVRNKEGGETSKAKVDGGEGGGAARMMKKTGHGRKMAGVTHSPRAIGRPNKK
jgi:hypothetical protein